VEREEDIEYEFIPFGFLNDGHKEMTIRKTQLSYHANPDKIQPQDYKVLYVRPGGFIKLWDYEDSYHLLVE